MELYPWQESCLKEWEKHGFHGIVHVVTGAGKTVAAIYGIIRLREQLGQEDPLRVKIVVPTCSLASQWAGAMGRHLSEIGSDRQKLGQWGGGRNDKPDRDYMIYVVNSARYSLARHVLADWEKGYGVLLIADECHHYASPENRKIFDFLGEEPRQKRQHPAGRAAQEEYKKRYYSLGLSATPQVQGFDSILCPALGPEIFQYNFGQAAQEKNVSPFAVCQIQLSFTSTEMAEYDHYSRLMAIEKKKLLFSHPSLKGLNKIQFFNAIRRIGAKEEDPDSPASRYLNLALKRQRLNYMASARASCTCSLLSYLRPWEKVIIFSERICQAEAVYSALNELVPGRVGKYHSEMEKNARKNALSCFQDGTYRVLVSCRGLDEGVDVPDASVGIILSGTSVKRQHIQRLGRILRPMAGKNMACMYYLYIKESAEESAFLPDSQESFPICNLSYTAFDHSFCHPVYETMAARLLGRIRSRGTGDELLGELRLCLEEGLVRSDWLLGEEICRERMETAQTQHEKNYWLSMGRLCQGSRGSP